MPLKSTFPDVEIPPIDIWTLLFENKDRSFPDDKVIFKDADTSRAQTYAEVKSTAINFGNGLKALLNWRKGDVLGLFTPNCIDTPSVIWGTHWAGGIVMTANPAFSADELFFQLRDTGARAIATQRPLLKIAVEAARRIGMAEEQIILIGDERAESGQFKHFTSIRNITGTSPYERTKMQPDELAFLVYSSGTTGRPKGVMLTHRNIVSNILQLAAVEGGELSWKGGRDGQGDQILALLPFFHQYGLNCCLHQSLYGGWSTIVMAKFDIEKFCQNIQRYRITFAHIVPPIVLLLAKHPAVDKYDVSSVRMLNCGAAPLTKDLVKAVYERAKIRVKQGYGLSEASPTTHSQPWDLWYKKSGSVGAMLPNQVAKFMSPEELEVPAGKTGELWIKGPNIFLGYLNNPEATRNVLTSDGFFKTGDIGHVDEEGNFYITDRVKELIKYKGFQVAPAELEGLLINHPAINDVAVIGVYDAAQATEVPRAYVVLKVDAEKGIKTANNITQWVQAKVARHKWLRGGVSFVDEIPKSPSGKILRRVLKDEVKKEEDCGEAKL